MVNPSICLGGMVKGVNSVALKAHPTSHLFSCRMDNLNM